MKPSDIFPAGSDFTLDDRSILVTGGTGSFGRSFIGSVIKAFKPRRLIVFSRDELKQFEMTQQFSDKQYPFLRYFIGDVRDAERLAMARRGVDSVVHAAALKQVPVAEYNPFECIRTNVFGAENVVRASMQAGVKRVIALSTDKAANPVNLYGASKLASDKIFVAANALSYKGGPRFAVVRYGNVVGSRGSVVPFFRQIIERGSKSLPITDRRMTRFFITLDQGVRMVLSSMAMMQGGEVFVPRIPTARIMDLAEALLPGVELSVIGIRPGEKLHEVMISEDDARLTLELDDRFIIEPAFDFWERGSYQTLGARHVADGFRYASDTNPDILSVPRIRDLLALADRGDK